MYFSCSETLFERLSYCNDAKPTSTACKPYNLDYLPALRCVCRIEEKRKFAKTSRRYVRMKGIYTMWCSCVSKFFTLLLSEVWVLWAIYINPRRGQVTFFYNWGTMSANNKTNLSWVQIQLKAYSACFIRPFSLTKIGENSFAAKRCFENTPSENSQG